MEARQGHAPRRDMAGRPPAVSARRPTGTRLLRRCAIAGLLLLLARLAAAGPGLAATLAAAVPPEEGQLTYDVLRNGKQVGVQTVEFSRGEDGALVVRTHAEIAVDWFLLPLYHFRHDSEERWEDGRLAALVSRTNDDGKRRAVELRREGDRLRGTYNGEARDLSGDLLPASFWHPETVRRSVLLDPVKGRPREVRVADLGQEQIGLPGGTVTAHRYAIRGQITRDVWYGPDGRLLQQRFRAKDGSEITSVLRSGPAIAERPGEADGPETRE